MKTKRVLRVLLALVFVLTLLPGVTAPAKAAGEVAINETNFPDSAFAQYVGEYLDQDGNGSLSAEEIAAVKYLYVGDMWLNSLKGIEYFTALVELNCSMNRLTELDLSKNTALKELDCSDNRLAGLNLSKNPALEVLYCSGNELLALDLGRNPALKYLDCSCNELIVLDLSGKTQLSFADCSDNKLKALDVGSCAGLMNLYSDLNELDSLQIGGCPLLIDAYLHGFKKQESIFMSNRRYWSYNLDDPECRLTVDENTEVIVAEGTYAVISAESFPDESFRYLVSNSIDTDRNGILDEGEIGAVTAMNVSYCGIGDLKGIEHFTALKTLYCEYNQLTSLDVRACTALTTLNCSNNRLTDLNVGYLRTLKTLNAANNPSLKTLDCHNCALTDLNIGGCTGLTKLYCGMNQLAGLDVTQNTALTELYCFQNKLTGLDLSRNAALTELNCCENSLASIDLRSCPNLLNALQGTVSQGTSGGTAYRRYENGGNLVMADASTHVIFDEASAAPAVTALTADKTAAKPGDSITWTAEAVGGSGSLRYNFYIYKDGAAVLKTGYTAAKTAAYTASGAGTYSVKVFVKDSAGTIVSKTGGNVAVAADSGALTVTGVTADKTAAKPGDSITWTAAASGGTGTLRYNFYICKDGAVVQKTGYAAAKTAAYTASEAGTYSVKVFVKDSAGTIVTKIGGTVTVAADSGALTVTGVTADKITAKVGDTITWTAAASGGSGTLRYCFYIYKDGAVVQKTGYTAAKTAAYPAAEAGIYSVKVFVKDSAGTVAAKTGGTVTVAAATQTLTILSVKGNKTSAKVGETVTWTAIAGGSGTLRYCFNIYKDGTIVQKGSYGAANTLTYTVQAAGNYSVKVYVKDGTGAAVSKQSAAVAVTG